MITVTPTFLQTLKAFSVVNPALLLNPGSHMVARDTGRRIQIEADVDVEIPKRCAFYDLSNFLALITTMKNATLDFQDDSVVIHSGDGGQVRYFYTDESLVTEVKSTFSRDFDEAYSWTFPKEEKTQIQKIASLISAETFSVVSKDGSVTVELSGDVRRDDTKSYRRVVGESSRDFRYNFHIEKLREIMDAEFDMCVGTVDISTQSGNTSTISALKATSEATGLTYYVVAVAGTEP